MIFKLYDCEVGIKLEGLSYVFDHVASVTIQDPEKNKLTRGANSTDKQGLAYKEGLKEPKMWTMPIMNMSPELKAVLDDAFENQKRCEVYAISRSNGSSKMARSALLANRPQQLTLDDTAESMQVSLEFESFDMSEVHKA